MKKDFRIETIIDKIKKTYRPLITHKKVEFIVENKPLKCEQIAYDKDTYQEFKTNFKFNNIEYSLTGEFGLVPDSNSERGGFKIFQYGRKVSEKEYFGHTDPSKRWNVERLYGELYIDFDLPLSMNKTEIDKDSELWYAIVQAMYNEIDEIIKEAIDYKTPTKNESKAVESINKKIEKTKKAKNGKVLDDNGHFIGKAFQFLELQGNKGETFLEYLRRNLLTENEKDTKLFNYSDAQIETHFGAFVKDVVVAQRDKIDSMTKAIKPFLESYKFDGETVNTRNNRGGFIYEAGKNLLSENAKLSKIPKKATEESDVEDLTEIVKKIESTQEQYRDEVLAAQLNAIMIGMSPR